MVQLIKNFQDMLVSRVQNMVVMNFILAWSIWNYEIVLRALFKTQTIEERITYLQSVPLSPITHFLIPLGITMLYIFALPYLNLKVVDLYEYLVGGKIKAKKRERLTEHYKLSVAAERERLNSTEFLKTIIARENEIVDTEVRRKINDEHQKSTDLANENNHLKRESLDMKKEEKINNEKNLVLIQKTKLELLERIKLIKEENYEKNNIEQPEALIFPPLSKPDGSSLGKLFDINKEDSTKKEEFYGEKELCVNILKLYRNAVISLSSREIAIKVKANPHLTQKFLDKLIKDNYLIQNHNSIKGTTYSLGSKGSDYMIDSGIIT